MALLNAQLVDADGHTVTLAPASVGGDTFKPTSDRAKLMVRNGSGASINVTVATPGTVGGLAISERVMPVAAGAIAFLPLYKHLYANPADGLLSITYSAVTTVDVAVIYD